MSILDGASDSVRSPPLTESECKAMAWKPAWVAFSGATTCSIQVAMNASDMISFIASERSFIDLIDNMLEPSSEVGGPEATLAPRVQLKALETCH